MKIRYLLLCLVVCASVLLCGCSSVRALPDYRERDFCATVRFKSEGEVVVAELVATCGEAGARLCSVTLLSPPALAGATLEECEEGIVMTVEGIRAVSVGAEEIFHTCSLLVAEGEWHPICKTEWNGLDVAYVEIGEGEGRCSAFCDQRTGVPIRIEREDWALTVERFLHT